jgi:nucleoid-associated protein YejK
MDNLPTWKECDKKHDNQKTLNAIEQFIYDWEPVGGLDEKEFREDLAAVLEYCQNKLAQIPEAMRPTGGRMWTGEQHACFGALTACADNIRNAKLD